MINFRFHLISLVAVFLALGIGVVVGSTVIDRATIDVLESQQEQLRASIEDVQARNEELLAELQGLEDRDEQLADQSDVLVDGRLAGTPVLVVSTWNADEDVVGALREALVVADAVPLGEVRLTEELLLGDVEARAALAEVLGVPADTDADALRVLAASVVAEALIAPPGLVPAPGQPTRAEVLDGLRQAGVVELDQPEGAPDQDVGAPTDTRVVVVGGPPTAADDAELDAGTTVAVAVVDELLAANRGVLAAQASAVEPDEEAWGDSLVGVVRERAETDLVATVDNLNDVTGRLAAVYALDDLGQGLTGHYGLAPGADRRLPPPS